VVQVEENMCLLERTYPVAGQKVTLIFQPLLDLDSMEMFVVADDRSDSNMTASTRFVPAAASR
jgi:hypothetical protein